MKKSTKTLFQITAGLSVGLSVVFMLLAILLIFNIGGAKDLYAEIIVSTGAVDPSDVNFEIYMAMFDTIISVFLNSYCAGLYFKLAKSRVILIGGSKMAMYLGILQCLFIVSLIPGIMAVIGSFILKKEEANIINRPRESMPTSQEIFEQKIKDMKEQKDKGNITQEQFDKFLNDMIEQQAVINLKQGNIEKSETLQDKLQSLKEEKENKKDN